MQPINKLLNLSDVAKFYNKIINAQNVNMPPLRKNDETYVYEDQAKSDFIADFFINCVQCLSITEVSISAFTKNLKRESIFYFHI